MIKIDFYKILCGVAVAGIAFVLSAYFLFLLPRQWQFDNKIECKKLNDEWQMKASIQRSYGYIVGIYYDRSSNSCMVKYVENYEVKEETIEDFGIKGFDESDIVQE